MATDQSLNILLVGGESAGTQTLKLLANSPHRIVGVLATRPSDHQHGGLWNAATKLGLTCLPAGDIQRPEFAVQLELLGVDVLLNVHSLYLIPAAVLEACRIGAFNLHPGPLPEYAGLDVPSWAIYNGETWHGVTLHAMVPKIDAGSIAYQSRFEIGPTDTGLKVMSNCVRHGMRLVKALLDDLYRDPTLVPQTVQDLSRRRYFFRQAPNGGLLEWNRSAVAIADHVRAADYSPFDSPWGHPVCQWGQIEVGVIRALASNVASDSAPGTVGDATDTGVLVASSDNWVEVQLVTIDGHRRNAVDVLPTDSILHNQYSDVC